MNTVVTSLALTQPSHSSAFQNPISPETLRERVPAVFAAEPTSAPVPRIPSSPLTRAEGAWLARGSSPVEARQAARARSPMHARHLIRLRRRFETIQLRDAIPEILFLNSHDGTSAYQLRVGLFRVVCTNGLVVSAGVFPVWRVDAPGRRGRRCRGRARSRSASASRCWRSRWSGWSGRFSMQGSGWNSPVRRSQLRFPKDLPGAMEPSQLLVPRRPQDVGNDLWRTFNVIQENVLQGGLVRRSASNRLTRSRRITAIREDVRLNSALWEMAVARAA